MVIMDNIELRAYAVGYFDGRTNGKVSLYATETELVEVIEYQQGYDEGITDYCDMDGHWQLSNKAVQCSHINTYTGTDMKLAYKEIQVGRIVQLGRMTKIDNKRASGCTAEVLTKWADTHEQAIHVRVVGALPDGQARDLIVSPYNIASLVTG